jgi:ATP-binding cassette subfamily C exporter for protease/lipase
MQDFKIVRTFISSHLIMALLDAPAGLLFLVIIMYIHPNMGYASMAAAVLMLIITINNERKIKPLIEESNSLYVQSQLYIADSISNAQTAQSMGMLESLKKKWKKIYGQHVEKMSIATENQVTSGSISKLLMLLQGSIVLGIGCWLTLVGSLPPDGGNMIIASILGGKALQPLMRLISGWKVIFTTKESYKNLEDFLENNQPRISAMKLPPPKGNLEIENLIARPPGSKNTVVNGMSFSLKQGRSLAIIGPSGSGKSSLTKLLVGVWPPMAGSVRLDDANIFMWDKKELGDHIGYLPQEMEMIEGTIAENICRFGEIKQPEIEKATQIIGLHDYIMSLKNGYETLLTGEIGLFSGGQMQKLGLARAIYGDPKLVVLDEPNSNLDEKGEVAFYETLKYLNNKGTTVVLVTHRPEVLNHVDRILVMVEGKPKLYGPRDSVLEKLAGKNLKTVSPEEAQKYKKTLV